MNEPINTHGLVTKRNRCGSCTMCCKLIGVHELAKPPNTWCQHCEIGVGCKIYDARPSSCAAFQCTWFANHWMAEELRPDRCKIVFEGAEGGRTMLAMVDPGRPDAWRAPAARDFISFLMRRHDMAFMIMSGPKDIADPTILLPTGRTVEDVWAEIVMTAKNQLARAAENSGHPVERTLFQAMVHARRDAAL